MRQQHQTTLRKQVALSGTGVHSGRLASIILHPAPTNHGVVFLRTGLPGGADRLIGASHRAVTATELCTCIGQDASEAVATIEHLMSALWGLGVDNVLVEVDGPELPILDGSAEPFVRAIDEAGLTVLRGARRFIKVLKRVRVERAGAFVELEPNPRGFRLDVEIDFQNPVIGRQRRIFDLSPQVYRRDICRARTFGFIGDVEKLWKAGFALGASLDNTVAIGDQAVINPEGLRFADEFVRHKALDAIGDLALAGSPLLASYRSYCAGHRLNVAALEELMRDRSNYAIVEGERRREKSYAELGGVAMPAFAANMR